MTKKYIKVFGSVVMAMLFLASCLFVGARQYANLNEPHIYPIPGFGGEYVYEIYFAHQAGKTPLPVEAAEGREHSKFVIKFLEKSTRNDVSLNLSLSSIRFTNLETGQVYTTKNKIKENHRFYVYSSSAIDLPLGSYRIEFSGRFCANGLCKNFSENLEKEIYLKVESYSRY